MRAELSVLLGFGDKADKYHDIAHLIEKILSELYESSLCDLSKLRRVVLSADFHKDLSEMYDEYFYSIKPHYEHSAVLRKLSDDGFVDEITLLLNLESLTGIEPDQVRILFMEGVFLCYGKSLFKYKNPSFYDYEAGLFFDLTNNSFLFFLSSSMLPSHFRGADKSAYLNNEVDCFISMVKECRVKLMACAIVQKNIMWRNQHYRLSKRASVISDNFDEINALLSIFSFIYGYYSSGFLDEDCFLRLKDFLQEEKMFDVFNNIGLANIELKKAFDKNNGFDDHEVFFELGQATIKACDALGFKYI